MINLQLVKQLFLHHTSKTGNINQLRSPHKKQARAEIMGMVTGKISMANSHSGFHKVRDAMVRLYKATGECNAAIDHNLSVNARH